MVFYLANGGISLGAGGGLQLVLVLAKLIFLSLCPCALVGVVNTRVTCQHGSRS